VGLNSLKSLNLTKVYPNNNNNNNNNNKKKNNKVKSKPLELRSRVKIKSLKKIREIEASQYFLFLKIRETRHRCHVMPTIFPCSGRYSGQGVHKSLQISANF
jgi:hypothetical protein